VIRGQGLRDLAQPGGDRFIHTLPGGKVRLLRDVGDAQTRLSPQTTIVECAQTSDRLEQAGLATAVTADQADTFAGIQLHLGMIEQGHMTIGQAGRIQGKQRHENNHTTAKEVRNYRRAGKIRRLPS
jgi:hypothetical protein